MQSVCKQCHTQTVGKLIEKFKPEQSVENFFLTESMRIIYNGDVNPKLATEIHRLARYVFANNNLYEIEKERANKLLFNDYDYWKSVVLKSDDTFKTAAKLAVAGNVIDYGAHSVPIDIKQFIIDSLKKHLVVDQTELLQKAVSKAKSVLYLGDNAGEIVFDKLFIEVMNHANVTFVVRGNPVINDVTSDDANQIDINEVANVIDNGYDAPSTLLEYCSDRFIEAYKNADIIISKGQGNFEGLLNSGDPRIFFMLMAKCEPMADLLSVKKGNMVIKRLVND